MFRKRNVAKKKFTAVKSRRRSMSDNSDDSNDDIVEVKNNIREVMNGSVGGKLSHDKSAASLLSFQQDEFEDNGEDTTDVFKVKKSSVSRKLIRLKKGQQRKEAAQELLKRNGFSSTKVSNSESDKLSEGTNSHNHHESASNGGYEREEKNGTGTGRNHLRILSGHEAEALHMEDEDNNDQQENIDRITFTKRPSLKHSNDLLKSSLKSGMIPNASAIFDAKKLREAARNQKGGVGRAALNGTNSSNFISLNASTNRNNRAVVNQRKEVVSSDFDDDEKEITDAWEEMQIKKSGMDTSSITYVADSYKVQASPNSTLPSPSSFNSREGYQPSVKPTSKSLTGVKQSLKIRLNTLKEVKDRHENDLDRLHDQMMESDSIMAKSKTDMPLLTEKFEFMQNIRGYVSDLIDCYNEKIVRVKYVEERKEKLALKISKVLTDRRKQDLEDRVAELKVASESVDEDTIAKRKMRIAERIARKRRRGDAKSSASKVISVQQVSKKVPDGWSTDEELPSNLATEVDRNVQDIKRQTEQIFEDVHENFACLRDVVRRFQDWKDHAKFGYTFSDAKLTADYLAKIFSPLIRLNLLKSEFNPLTILYEDFENFDWFELLSDFDSTICRMLIDDDVCDESDAHLIDKLMVSTDMKNQFSLLIPTVIEKVILPRTTSYIQSEYNFTSSKHTEILTANIKRWRVKYPTLVCRSIDSKQIRKMCQTVKDKMEHTLNHELYVPIAFSKQIVEQYEMQKSTGISSHSPHAALSSRQFNVCLKIMANVTSFNGILSSKLISTYALHNILNRYLMVSLSFNPRVESVLLESKRVVSVMPKAWFNVENVIFSEVSQHLERFCKFLMKLVNSSRNNNAATSEHILMISHLLKFMGFVNESREVYKIFE